MGDAPSLGIESLSIHDTTVCGESTGKGALPAGSTSLNADAPEPLKLLASVRHGCELLPTELWCAVWQHLPMGDRVLITHVCRRWREIALHWRALWTGLEFYTTRYHPDSKHPAAGPLYEPGWEEYRYPKKASNSKLILHVVALSGNLELDLAINVVPYMCDERALNALAVALSSHISRIAHLSCVTSDPQAVACFLRNFHCLPALRSIRMSGPGFEEFEDDEVTELFLRATHLPRLEVLHIRKVPAVIWPVNLNMRLLALRSLTLHIGRVCHLLYALQACPALTSLRIKLNKKELDLYPLEAAEWKKAEDAIRAIPACRVDGLYAADERGPLLAAFLNPDRQRLTLDYENFPREKGFGILREVGLSGSIRVVATQVGLGYVVLRTDSADPASRGAHARIRELMFRAKDPILEQRIFKRIWADETLLARVRHMSVNDAMWARFVETVPPDNRLDLVELVISMGSTLRDLIVPDVSPVVRFPCLTVLSVVVVPGATVPIPGPVAAADIAAFVRCIGSVLPIRTLMLARSLMPLEPIPASHELAQCINVR